MKQRNRKIVIGIIIILAIALVFFLYFKKPVEVQSINQGVGMKAFVVDAQGNILREIGSNDNKPTLSIVAPPSGTGFDYIDNINTFLAISSQLDNTAGDSEVTVTDVLASNPCSVDNTHASCPSITNIFGVSGVNKGDLNAKYDTLLGITGLVLPAGQVASSIISNPMSVATIEFGKINFTVNAIGTFLDAQGGQQALNRFGNLILRVNPSTCDGTTEADPTIANDNIQYCAVNQVANPGKYCRISSTGNANFVDNAVVCECPSGYDRVGDVCKSQTCGGSWAPNTCNPSGGILFCKSDNSIESRCNYCTSIGATCPVGPTGPAIGCNPSTGEPSNCLYPQATGTGFKVQVAGPSFTPIASCGDGFKDVGENCDKTDFGGVTCKSLGYAGGTLSCKNLVIPGDCTYDVSLCQQNYAGFRVSLSTYTNINTADAILADNWIAYIDKDINPAKKCGDALVGYGYDAKSGGTGSGNACNVKYGTPLIANIPHVATYHIDISYVDTEGDGVISLHRVGSDLYLCENTPDDLGYGYYRYRTSRTNNALTSQTYTGDVKETIC